MQGLKTVLAGLLVAVGPAAVEYVAGLDPVATFGVSPTAGAVIGAAMVALRAFTSTAIFSGLRK